MRLVSYKERLNYPMPEFGVLRNLDDLRQIWPHEAGDFTPWLADNIERLGEAIGLDLELTRIEADAGDFCCDLLAKDLGTGRNVIVENQLTTTDHDHLGKLITYASAFDPIGIIWVTKEIREEHRQALQWLNEQTSENTHFFGVVIELLQIDNSKPAFHFRPVVFPNEWQRRSRSTANQGSTPRAEAYRQFFQRLIDELREKHKFTGARAAQPQNWYAFSSGVSGIAYGASFAQDERLRVECYIDLGDSTLNKAFFNNLLKERERIEKEFGGALEWEPMESRRACRVATYFSGTIDSSAAELEAIRENIIDRLLRLKKAVGPNLKNIARQVSVAQTAGIS
jgi:hypothetical protein